MPVDQKCIPVDQLQKGMYISKLDRPWIETPFPLQGFYVRDLKDIDSLNHKLDALTAVIAELSQSIRKDNEKSGKD